MKKILLKLRLIYMKIFNRKKRGLMFEFPNVKVKIVCSEAIKLMYQKMLKQMVN